MLAAELHKTESLLSSLWNTWGAAAGFAVAVIALLVSMSQTRIAKKALRLSLLQDERSHARLEANLRNAVDWFSDEASRWIGVHVLVLNASDSQGALTEAELSITYRTSTGRLLVLKVPYNVRSDDLPEGVARIVLPAALSNNGAVEGWLTFQVHNSLLEGAAVESYTVTVYDSRGISANVQPIIFQRVELS
jgi:hypothetical protein